MKSSIILCSTIAAFLVSCAVPISPPPSSTEISRLKASHSKPSVASAETALREYAFQSYKDPESLKLRGTKVHAFCFISFSGTWKSGYLVTTMLDAKNGRGAYGGYRHHEFLMTKLGNIVETQGQRLSSESFQFYPIRRYRVYGPNELIRLGAQE